MDVKPDYDSLNEFSNLSQVSSDIYQNGRVMKGEVETCFEEMEHGYCGKCDLSVHMLKAHKAGFHRNKEEKRCTLCGQLFFKSSELLNHLLGHKSDGLECRYCSTSNFVEFEDLFQHLEEHVFLHIYMCHLCSESFAVKSNLEDHITAAHESPWKRPFLECLSCPQRFESRNRGVRKLKQHWIEEHSKLFKCLQCNKRFSKFIVFYNHSLRHAKLLPYICGKCRLGFRKLCRLREHEETMHQNKRNYKCLTCDKEFKHKPSFDAHLRSHDKSLRFACHHCSKLFLRKISLLDHFLDKSCSACDEIFHCRTMFDRHFKTYHKLDRIFSCDKCSKSYVLENALKRHNTLTHLTQGESMFRCAQCPYETITRHNLNRHKRRNH